jgi:nitrile hydratase beta subunit
MNGAHDMGGMHGFGPVEREENEPLWHAAWEPAVVGIMQGLRGRQRLFNIDEMRRGIESMAPADYLAAGYYERWLSSLETLLVEKGVLTHEEIDARTEHCRAHPDAPLPDPPGGGPAAAPPPTGIHPYRRDGSPPRFKPGDRVTTRNAHPAHHTRLPRYARGKRGVIERVYGVFVFPDTHAHGQGECPQPLYNVRFAARDLWGDSAEPNEHVSIDLWESYLEE